MNWPLVVVILALLLFGYCVYSVRETTRTVDRVLEDENWTNQRCYAAGYEAALAERTPQRPEDEECARWFQTGFADGQRAYEGLLP